MNKQQKIKARDDWNRAYEEARASHAAGEPLIRTVTKIVTLVLIVVLVVGLAAGVML
ncbi:hypothetical protein D3C75_851920 [compost metagenome]